MVSSAYPAVANWTTCTEGREYNILTCGWCIAGLTLDAVKGSKTSCYIGTFTGDFEELQVRDNEGPSMYHATGLSSSLASNRLSWFYDLKGPSMTIDTACSSSLTAFHLACQSLRTGEATMVSGFSEAFE